MLDITVDDSGITINTGKEEISAISGAVTFRPGEDRGERCFNEYPIALSDLGLRGEGIVRTMRSIAPEARVMISPHNLRVTAVNGANLKPLELALRELWSIGTVSWLSAGMVRIHAPRGTTLSNSHRVVHFDPERSHLVHFDRGDKLLIHELTEHGRHVLDRLIELAREMPLRVVGISRDFVELCFDSPMRDKPNVHQALNGFRFAAV